MSIERKKYTTLSESVRSKKSGQNFQPIRTLAEFGKEVGKTSYSLMGLGRKHDDFPRYTFQRGMVRYYDYAELKTWWAKNAKNIDAAK